MEKKLESKMVHDSVTLDAITFVRLENMVEKSGMSMSDILSHAITRMHLEFSFQCDVFKRINRPDAAPVAAPVAVPELVVAVSEKTASRSRQVVSIDESASDQLHERRIAYVAKVIRRELEEFIVAYEETGKDRPEEVRIKLNDATFRAASFHAYIPDDFASQFLTAGQKCGLSESVSLATVSKALGDARKKTSRVPNINNESRAKVRRFDAPGRPFDAADAAAGILDQLRGPRSNS